MFGFSVEWRHLQYPNEVASMDSLLAAFEGINDPRVERTKAYPLADIMFLLLCAVLCGVESWRGVEDFGEDRLEWLQTYLPFENGVPSHQTVGRVMSLPKGDCVAKAFVQFMASLFEKMTAGYERTMRQRTSPLFANSH